MTLATEEEMSPEQRLLEVLIDLATRAMRHAENARLEQDPDRRFELLDDSQDMAYQMWRHWHIRLNVLGLSEDRHRGTVDDCYDFLLRRLEYESVDGDGEGAADAITLLRTIRSSFVNSRVPSTGQTGG